METLELILTPVYYAVRSCADIVQLHMHISCLTSSLQSVLLLLMFIEVIVVMARNDYHPRVLRALRPIFFINSHLMYDLRR